MPHTRAGRRLAGAETVNENAGWQIRNVVFDIGGVLCADPWETLVLTPGVGIADRLGIDHAIARLGCRRLWLEFSKRPTNEQDYWNRFGEITGITPPGDLVAELENQIWRVDDFQVTVDLLRRLSIRVGVISDNTEFWFRKQLEWIPGLSSINAEDLFLSYQLGCRKSSPRISSLSALAHCTIPRRTIILDDRFRNVLAARNLGFRAYRYTSGITPRRIYSRVADLMRTIGYDIPKPP